MTAIVGIKKEGKILLAADGTSVYGNNKDPFDNQKVIRPLGSSRLLLAYTGTRSFVNAIAAETRFFGDDKHLDFFDLVYVIVPKLFEFGIDSHLIKKDADGYYVLPGSFLIGTSDCLFHIDPYGVVHQIEGYCAYGFGAPLAFSSLLTTEDSNMSIEQRAVLAIQTAIRYAPGLGYPIYLGTNQKKDILVFPKPSAVQQSQF